MKRLSLLASTMMLFITINYAQDSLATKPADKMLSTQYFEKGKRQTKTAAILGGSGFVLGAVAVAIFPKDYDILGNNTEKTEHTANIANAMFITGAVLLVASIPFFIAGGINKHKAKLRMKTERVSLSPQLNLPAWQLKTVISINI